MTKTVRMTMDEILQDREASDERLASLANLPDDQIDLSDIPEATEEFWENARPFNEVMKELASQRAEAEKVTLTLDQDVLKWLKRDDESQVDARANALLRDAMVNELIKKSA